MAVMKIADEGRDKKLSMHSKVSVVEKKIKIKKK